MHVLRNRLVAPGAELADGCRNHVEAAPAAGYLEQVDCPVEHGCCLLDVALADVREGQSSRGRSPSTCDDPGGGVRCLSRIDPAFALSPRAR